MRCAELQTIEPRTKNFSHVAPSLTMSQKYLCISLRDTALGGINYRQSGGGTLSHMAGGYVRHIADNFINIVRIRIIRLIPLPLRTQEVRCRSCVSRHTRASSTCTPSPRRQDGTPPGGPDRGPRGAHLERSILLNIAISYGAIVRYIVDKSNTNESLGGDTFCRRMHIFCLCGERRGWKNSL